MIFEYISCEIKGQRGTISLKNDNLSIASLLSMPSGPHLTKRPQICKTHSIKKLETFTFTGQ